VERYAKNAVFAIAQEAERRAAERYLACLDCISMRF